MLKKINIKNSKNKCQEKQEILEKHDKHFSRSRKQQFLIFYKHVQNLNWLENQLWDVVVETPCKLPH